MATVTSTTDAPAVQPPALPAETGLPTEGLTTGRNLKIGLFHLGSGMADVLTTGIWNRIMISDLGFSATPIGLLIALRYFLAPLGILAGRLSDQRTVLGYRRLFWVWLGRGMMASSSILLGVVTGSLARGNPADLLHWGVIAASLVLFSLGSACSSSTFLALIYDRARPDQRGRAVGIVWTFLLLGLTFGGFAFSVLLPAPSATLAPGTVGLAFSPDTLVNLFLLAGVMMASLWFFSLLGEERRSSGAAASSAAEAEGSTTLLADLRLAWSNPRTRAFFWYLGLSMLFAFSQDLILEPFAAEVLGMDARHTTRFTAYWGGMAILGTIGFLILGRRYKQLTNTIMNYIGVSVLVSAFVVFAVSSFFEIRGIVTPGLILLGLGLGIWNVGTLGLMMDMSPFGRAGTFLGFWTLVVTLARGGGVSGGGVLRDLGIGLFGDPALVYGMAFTIGAGGLVAALVMLSRVKVKVFKAETAEKPAPIKSETAFVGGLD